MSGAYSVDRQQLLDSVERMQIFEQRLTSAMETAQRRVTELHATWTGLAADEHRQAHARWQHATEQMHTALVVMRRIAHGAHGNYTAAATANTSMWTV